MVDKSCSGNKAQLVGAQDGSVIVPQYNWTEYFGNGVKVQGIKQRQQFKFSKDYSGKIALFVSSLVM